ncbi:ROK family transcriptional regulator [Telmatospirillum sp.]|uniref:ROK family transcriptional regulator n=1 Tax=Telmatospirillum sp. TaxID=2079197 RepID=UPI00284E75AC|nr:ROK family transcriptional regulator [Telmatospirillum sp.]MDR3435653.1 ROK family transcriptional regulator [Telmatospirillum sp.]
MEREVTPTDWTNAPFEEARDVGANQSGMRQFNERVVLQIIRRAGSLPKADIARVSNLSAQTVSVIINQLIVEELLVKQDKVKGKIGQPSVPIALNPHGAYSIGVSIDRHQVETILIGFTGDIMNRTAQTYPYPDPEFIFPLIHHSVEFITRSIPAERRKRLAGIGVAAPSFIVGKWEEQLNAPPEVMAQWKNIDIRAQVSTPAGPPVYLAKDTTAACLAELMFGSGLEYPNYLYVFIGSFLGGGIVLNGSLFPGMFGNAGAIGSIQVPDVDDQGQLRGFRQLADCAALFTLEETLKAFGLTIEQAVADGPAEAKAAVEAWIANSAQAVAHAIASACAVIDFDGIVIDGTMPRRLLDAFVQATTNALNDMRLDGIVRPWIRAGAVGADATSLGGAILPFYSSFVPNDNILRNLPD